jgi:hypothetical protein
MDIMIGADSPHPHQLLSKTSQIYVAGLSCNGVVLVVLSRLDKHKLVISEWGDFSSEVSPFSFLFNKFLNPRSSRHKTLNPYCVYNYSSAKGKFNSFRYLVQCPLETKNDSVVDESQGFNLLQMRPNWVLSVLDLGPHLKWALSPIPRESHHPEE